MATIQIERRKRGLFGKLFLLLFWLFNLAMIVWLIAYWVVLGRMSGEAAGNAAGQAGLAIGGTLGTGTLLVLWLLGDTILGALCFFSRGPKIIETREA